MLPALQPLFKLTRSSIDVRCVNQLGIDGRVTVMTRHGAFLVSAVRGGARGPAAAVDSIVIAQFLQIVPFERRRGMVARSVNVPSPTS